jgi:thiamine-phosphate pyrophosphorylase
LISDRRRVESLERAIAAAVSGGVTMVQIREKDLPARELLELTRRVADVVAGRAQLLVNGRADVAFAVEGCGLHLPADGLTIEVARRVLGGERLVGRSVHSVAEAAALQAQDVDYLELGTIFPSASHPGGPTVGLDVLREAASLSLSVLAVGGITAHEAGAVIEAGAAGVAVISEILGAEDPEAAAARLREAVLRAWRSPGSRSPAVGQV